MRRWHSERELMLKRWRQELGNHVYAAGMTWQAPPVMACGIECHCARGIGTMRKQRPYGGYGWNKWDKHFDHKKRGNARREAIRFEQGQHWM